MAIELDDLYRQRLAQAQALEEAGVELFPSAAPLRSHKNQQVKELFSSLDGKEVDVVGRLVSKRDHRRSTFADLEDESGRIQTFWSEDGLGSERFPLFRDNLGLGDFLGVHGEVIKSRTGEITVHARDLKVLTKALRVPPERILDPEIQVRQRYLQTLADRSVRDRFRVRSKIVQHMRDYFINNLGCLEVETPVLDTTYGGASARPFETKMWALDNEKMYLRIANELYLKRLTVGGYYQGVFEFSRNFRNEGIDAVHHPEFTLMELYMPFWDYLKMMDMAEELMSSLVLKIHGSYQAPFGETMINYAPPWGRLKVNDGLSEKLGRDPRSLTDDEVNDMAANLDIDKVTRGERLLEIFEKLWGPELVNPTFVMDYPIETSALTKRHRTDPGVVERFELFVAGSESMNCYSELNDPRDQRQRFEAERAKREQGDTEAMPFDEDFIRALEYGMPLQAGIGISVDRWTMLMTNISQIRQVIYFPANKALKS